MSVPTSANYETLVWEWHNVLPPSHQEFFTRFAGKVTDKLAGQGIDLDALLYEHELDSAAETVRQCMKNLNEQERRDANHGCSDKFVEFCDILSGYLYARRPA